MKTFSSILAAGVCLAGFLPGGGVCRAQNLSVTDGLQLWLKADAGTAIGAQDVVLSWEDQSGKENHASAFDGNVAPTLVANALNGKPVLRFDGADDYLEVADSESLSFIGDLTTFFVVKFDDFATFRAVWGKTVVNFPGPTDFYALPNSGIPRALRGNGSNANYASADGGIALRSGSYLTVGFDVAGTSLTHYLGAQPTGGGDVGTAVVLDGETPLRIGSRDDLFTKMKGDIAELVIYDRALSPAERTSVVDYLGQKYNIQNLPPTVTLNVTPPGANVPPGTVVTLNAAASDPDGTIARVEFLVNGGVVATATAAPFQAKVRLDTPSSYEFTARAVDDKDGTGTSTPVMRTVTSGGPPVLGVTSDLQLWMKADAGVGLGGLGEVMSWADQSGQNNDAAAIDTSFAPTVTAAAINGQPAIHFDGVDDFLEVPDSESVSITGDMTTFFVVRMDDFSTFRGVWAKTSGNLPAPNDFYTLPGGGQPRLFRGDGTGTGIGNVDATRGLRAGVFEMVGITCAGAATTHFLNGQLNGAGNINTVNADLDTPLRIGTRDDLVTRLSGDLAELLIYNAALSTADRRSVETYLGSKYALPVATHVNDAPTAAITAPAGGSSFLAPVDVTVNATAGDADGAVQRVEFLVNGTVAGTDTSDPYSATINFTVGGTPALTVRAIDNLGAVTVSAPVDITITSQNQIPLPGVANLRLWLRADAGVTAAAGAVSQWNDSSGNLNNATQAQGTLQPMLVADAVNTMPVVRFDGVDDYLGVNSSPTLAIQGDIATYFVIRIDDFAGFRAVWTKTENNQPRSTDFYTLPDSGIARAFRGGSAGIQSVDSTQPLLVGEYQIVAFEQAGTTLRHYLNGQPNGEGEVTVAMQDVGTPLLIGTRGDLFTKMKGDIAEIIIYDAVPDDAGRGQIWTYLGQKYGIPISVEATPDLSITRTGSDVNVFWPPEVTGWTLDSSLNFLINSWQPVPGVVNNSVTETATGAKFYRLRKP